MIEIPLRFYGYMNADILTFDYPRVLLCAAIRPDPFEPYRILRTKVPGFRPGHDLYRLETYPNISPSPTEFLEHVQRYVDR